MPDYFIFQRQRLAHSIARHHARQGCPAQYQFHALLNVINVLC